MQLDQILARLHDGRHLTIDQWALQPGEYWAVCGTNGSGKTVVSRLFAGDVVLSHGQVTNQPGSTEYVSLEAQAELLAYERHIDQSDLLDQPDKGTRVADLLAPLSTAQSLIDRLDIRHLLDSGFKSLSTGESRKVMLVRALLKQPDMLVLDEPFEGLDQPSREALTELLDEYVRAGHALLWVANRLDELPDWITHLAFMHDARLLLAGTRQQVESQPDLRALLHFDGELPEFPAAPPRNALTAGQALVEMRDTSVRYDERVLFEQLNWTVLPGQHWAIQGPNGCGKSSLLQLITGDNPQCYRNDLTLFGIRRGTGESIWDIKQHIGLVSSALQWQYRATTNVLSALLSGLHDSIGLYAAVGDDDKRLGLQWLDILGLGHKANQSLQHLSYGEQRLILIARALIKQPPLLILDEPCQGLDDISREMVLAFIQRLAQQQSMTLLYVTHHADEIPAAIQSRLLFEPKNTQDGSRIVVQQSDLP
ncbi:molybdate ABC transporter ATP-binding protein ModF [Bacterioplanes sanyensis]|uniref:Molybdate ABC transporter ATP-binding protein ModF n=1 Tax=Bacterioplanes sanyensis TaxID=1249553 RepID=A0A222FGP6_9GAMM|nr:molybdate ABC transporter ATP-binding protein ModF [Bacterioplanes sanyensis]ASP38237.1 molybdate ABC transporter ATP-binding protein ModF [Bacterioplanes sanyensis]